MFVVENAQVLAKQALHNAQRVGDVAVEKDGVPQWVVMAVLEAYSRGRQDGYAEGVATFTRRLIHPPKIV